ncbi:hypothetical protein BGX34_005244 [Mortierella sp. NVP85]|nr:hypothetical protein BGX34_005244 [Mortierella sp. NVP85]
MKFTTIAIASAAIIGSAVSAAPFSFSCTTPIHYYGVSGIKPDITNAMRKWKNDRVIGNGREEAYQGAFIRVSCRVNDDTASSVYQKDCRNALSWLWNTVTADNSQWMDKAGYVPQSCWVQNGSALIKWQSK